jgi:hypothetical protein
MHKFSYVTFALWCEWQRSQPGFDGDRLYIIEQAFSPPRLDPSKESTDVGTSRGRPYHQLLLKIPLPERTNLNRPTQTRFRVDLESQGLDRPLDSSFRRVPGNTANE